MRSKSYYKRILAVQQIEACINTAKKLELILDFLGLYYSSNIRLDLDLL